MDRQTTLDRLLLSPFVGRPDELRRLRHALDDAAAHRVRVLGIGGEPGIGKTRLADMLAQHARAVGWWTCTIQCVGGDAAPAYLAWKQLLRLGLEQMDERVRQELFETTDRFVIAERLATILREAARQAPMLVVLEDLHDGDDPSLRLLPLVVSQLGAARVVLVFTTRHGEDTTPALAAATRQLRTPVFERLELSGLSADDVHAFIAQVAEQKVPRAFATRLRELSGGNPLFLRELLRYLIERDVLIHDGTRWTSRLTIDAMALPHSLQEIIRDRLERLSPDGRCVLDVAALFRSEFDIATLRRLDVIRDDRVFAAVDEALQARLITSAERPPGRFRFGHGVFREHLRGTMPIATRVALHRRIAEVLESGGTLNDARVFELAYHLLHAGLDGDPARAITWAVAAAKRLTEQAAYERAAEYYVAALVLGDAAQALSIEEQCELLCALTDVRHRAGDRDKARLAATAAARLARRHALPGWLARAALAFAGRLRGFGRLAFDTEAVALLEEALRVIDGRDEQLTAVLEARLAEETSFGDDRGQERRSDLAQRALARARRAGDPATLAAVLRSLHWALWTPEASVHRRAAADEIIQLATQADDDDLVLEGYVLRSLAAIDLGDVSGARIAHAVVRDRGGARPYYRWIAGCIEGCLAFMEGALDAVTAAAERAYEVGAEIGIDSAALVLGAQVGHLSWLRGPLDDIEALLRDLAAATPLIRPIADCALLAARVEQGALDEARRGLERLAEDDFRAVPRNALWTASMSFLAVACAEVGDDVRAGQLYALLEPFAEHTVLLPPALCLGSVHHFLGLLAATAGSREAACRHFENALTANARFGARHWMARTQLAYASTLLATSEPSPCDRELAGVLLEHAADGGRTLGMPRVVERAAQLARTMVTATAPSEANAPAYQLRRVGDSWELVFENERALLRDLRGLHYLREMLRRPYGWISCSVLYAAATHDGSDDGAHLIDLGHAGPVCDERTRREVRRELQRIEEEVTRRGERGEDCAALRDEARQLEAYLDKSNGWQGDTVVKDAHERFRQSVAHALKLMLNAIARHCPKAARHLDASLKRGRSCQYAPDPRRIPHWRLD